MTRDEHLAWAKNRALEYVDGGDIPSAWASFLSDMQKHAETQSHVGTNLGNQMFFAGMLSQPEQMRHFIEGFN